MTTITTQVDALFAAYDKPDSPGCALAIVQDGTVIYQRGYGCANLDYDLPITPESVFHVASVSKQFTALAILLLEADGKLSVNDDIRQYLPEMPDYGATITIQHLLHHTSGLRDQWDILSMAGWDYVDDLITSQHVLNLAVRQQHLNFKPGAEHVYCNTGYTLLAIIVERISGQSFREFTHGRIFQPLGMNHTHFHDDHAEVVKNRAMAYTPHEDGFRISIPTFDTVGATSLFTTALDLAIWAQNYKHQQVGGAIIAEKMIEPGQLNNGQRLVYASGLVVSPYKGLRTVGHAGGDAGYRAHFLLLPDHGLDIIVLSNLSKVAPGRIAQDIADLYLADEIETAQPLAIEQSAEERAVYTGLYYDAHAGETMQIIEKEDALYLDGYHQMTAVADDHYHLFPVEAEVIFARDEREKISGFALQNLISDETTQYAAVTAVAPAPDDLAQYVGNYTSTELKTDYDVVAVDGSLVLRHLRRKDMVLEPTFADGFKHEILDVLFVRNQLGDIRGFKLFTTRVRGLMFEHTQL